MFGIPEWAIGVAAIMAVIGVVQIISARLMPPGHRRRHWKFEQPQESEETQAKLAEVDELKRRIGELEERVDFTERLLAQKRESERLQP